MNLRVMTVMDQAGQLKNITGATILEYNRTTVFGETVNGKRTWLGKYNTPEEATRVQHYINEAIRILR